MVTSIPVSGNKPEQGCFVGRKATTNKSKKRKEDN